MLVTPGWVGPTQLGGHSVKANTTQHSKLKNRLKEREYSATKKALTLWYRNGDFIFYFLTKSYICCYVRGKIQLTWFTN